MADCGWTVQMDAAPVIEASVIPSDRRIENATSATPNEQRADMPAAFGSTQTTSAVKRKPDMLDTFKVSSWWRKLSTTCRRVRHKYD